MNTRKFLMAATFAVAGLLFSPFVATASAQSVLIDSYYSDWVSSYTGLLAGELAAAGYTIDFNTSPISSATLAGCDAYVLFFPGQTHTVTAAEGDTIANWVEAGHGLWLGGSMGGVGTTASCNAVATRWGVTFNTDDLSGVVTDITHGHLVTDGPNPPATQVDEFGYYMGSSLSLAGSLSLARFSGLTVMAAVEPGAGRAIFIGDSLIDGPFDDTNLYSYDNLTLAANTVGYVIPEPATLSLLALGGMALLRSRRRK